MRYGYSLEKEEQLLSQKKKIKIGMVADIILSIILWILLYQLAEKNWKLEEIVNMCDVYYATQKNI